MTNRNFRKNLALLCTLAGGVAALSSVNVPASAMDTPMVGHENNLIKGIMTNHIIADQVEGLPDLDMYLNSLIRKHGIDTNAFINMRKPIADFKEQYNYCRDLDFLASAKKCDEKRMQKLYQEWLTDDETHVLHSAILLSWNKDVTISMLIITCPEEMTAQEKKE